MFEEISPEPLFPHLKLISFVFVPSGWPTCPEPLAVRTVYSLISSPYVQALFVSLSVCTVGPPRAPEQSLCLITGRITSPFGDANSGNILYIQSSLQCQEYVLLCTSGSGGNTQPF